jgi:zinc protease
MRNAISNRNQVLVVYSPDKKDFNIPTDKQLQQYVLDAQARKYPAYKEKKLDKQLIKRLPKKGSIVSEKATIHGSTELTLSNGVKVYFKKTNYNNDQVIIDFFGEGGTSLYPDKDIINTKFIGTAVNEGGLANFDKLTLDKMLSGKSAHVNANVGIETQSITGQSSVKDVKTLFELAYLHFTSLRRDDKAFMSELNRMRSFLTNREASPRVSYNDSISSIVYGNSPRVQPMKAKDIADVDYNRVMQIYRERFSNASNFKMIVMGNISLDTLRPLLEQYVASLPSTGKKETYAPTYPNVRNCNETHKWEKQMQTPLSKVTIFYTWNEPYTAKTDLQLDVLKRVLSIAYTDSVREEKGGVYGVSLSASLDKNSDPHALMKIAFDTDPAKYDIVMPIIYKQITNIAQYGPEPSSMQKVKEYLLKQYDQVAITNDYWHYVLYNELRYGVDFDKDYKKMVNEITANEIQQMARNIINSNRRIEITMLSKK